MSIGSQCVACGGARAVETSWGVGAAVGAHMTPSRQSTLINIFTRYPINVTELVTTATVALVGAVDVGALLAARVGLAFIHIFTVPAVIGQFEACGAAALVGPLCVFTFMGTKCSRVMPAFIDIFTQFRNAVKGVSHCALTAVRAHQVCTAVTATHIPCTTLIHIFTTCAILCEVISSSTCDCIPATSVGAPCVHTGLTRRAWTGVDHTLIYVIAVANGILNVSRCTFLFWVAAERACCVCAHKAWSTVMSAQTTLINILASVAVCEFISSTTPCFSLTAKGTLCVYAKQAKDAVVTASQALVHILTVHTILFELIAIVTGTSTITYTQLGANGVFAGVFFLWSLCCNIRLRLILLNTLRRRFNSLCFVFAAACSRCVIT